MQGSGSSKATRRIEQERLTTSFTELNLPDIDYQKSVIISHRYKLSFYFFDRFSNN